MIRVLTRKARVLILAIAVIVAGAGVGGYLLTQKEAAEKKEPVKGVDYPQGVTNMEVYEVLQQAADLKVQGKVDEAIAKLDAYVESTQSDPNEKVDALIMKAGFVYPDMQKVGEIYDKAISIAPNSAKVYERAGKVYWGAEGFEKAKPYFEKALQAFDQYPENNNEGRAREYYEGLLEGDAGDALENLYR